MNICRIDRISRGKKVQTMSPFSPTPARSRHETGFSGSQAKSDAGDPFHRCGKSLISYREKHLWIKDAFVVDSTFFDIFTYRPVRGDLQTALYKPNTAVILKSLSDALFGNEDPIGKLVTLDNTSQQKVVYTVTAVVEESGKSHLHGEFFATLDSRGMGKVYELGFLDQ